MNSFVYRFVTQAGKLHILFIFSVLFFLFSMQYLDSVVSIILICHDNFVASKAQIELQTMLRTLLDGMLRHCDNRSFFHGALRIKKIFIEFLTVKNFCPSFTISYCHKFLSKKCTLFCSSFIFQVGSFASLA